MGGSFLAHACPKGPGVIRLIPKQGRATTGAWAGELSGRLWLLGQALYALENRTASPALPGVKRM